MLRSYRDHAIVLRTYKLGEADRILALLTREHGQVRVVAKGARRITSTLGARAMPFNVLDAQIHRGRSLGILQQAVALHLYSEPIGEDYELYTSAAVMVEAAGRLCTEGAEGTHGQFRLLAGALAVLARRAHDPGLVRSSYLLRAMAVGGWAPSCDRCAVCGRAGPHRSFSIPAGGAVCTNCRPPDAIAVEPRVVRMLGALLAGDWPAAQSADPATRTQAAGLVAAYTQWHLERRLRSLPFLEHA